ncbi:MAG: HD-GYP domain-containing protein [Betaproteobacteria bacterium]
MNPIALPAEFLQVHDALPFDVVDAEGRMLLPMGTPIADLRQLDRLRCAGPMADAGQSDAWRSERERAAAGRLAADADDDEPAACAGRAPLEEARELPLRLAPLLRNAALVLDWPRQIERLAGRVRADVGRDADSLLYLLVQRAARYHENYSTEHALLCAVVCAMCAEPLHHGDEETRSLVCAALSMNVSMTTLQDELAQRERTPTLAQRRAIDEHAADSARLLRQVGVADELWVEVVALHHRNPDPDVPLAELPPGARLASVLRRVDVFTAKISARRNRAGLPAPLAARDACLGPNGLPDTVGAATVKALSIYPPGSYVRLANSETAVVVRRGARADRPQVVSLLAPNGRPLSTPQLRDTTQPRHEIRAAVRASEVRVAVNHEQVLAMAV